jgi:large subunit ribosomal protein L1
MSKITKRKKLINSEIIIDKPNYSIEDSLSIISSYCSESKGKSLCAKFDESIDIDIGIDIDPKKESFRTTVVLPNFFGQKANIMVFTNGDVSRFNNIGCVLCGGDELIEKIKQNPSIIKSMSITKCCATRDVMQKLSTSLARILGPVGLMPNPKIGSVLDSDDLLLDYASSYLNNKSIDIKNDSGSSIRMSVGRISMLKNNEHKNVIDNIGVALSEIRMVLSKMNVQVVKYAKITTTMSPFSIPLELAKI